MQKRRRVGISEKEDMEGKQVWRSALGDRVLLVQAQPDQILLTVKDTPKAWNPRHNQKNFHRHTKVAKTFIAACFSFMTSVVFIAGKIT